MPFLRNSSAFVARFLQTFRSDGAKSRVFKQLLSYHLFRKSKKLLVIFPFFFLLETLSASARRKLSSIIRLETFIRLSEYKNHYDRNRLIGLSLLQKNLI